MLQERLGIASYLMAQLEKNSLDQDNWHEYDELLLKMGEFFYIKVHSFLLNYSVI